MKQEGERHRLKPGIHSFQRLAMAIICRGNWGRQPPGYYSSHLLPVQGEMLLFSTAKHIGTMQGPDSSVIPGRMTLIVPGSFKAR
jgi:hypothetical protein